MAQKSARNQKSRSKPAPRNDRAKEIQKVFDTMRIGDEDSRQAFQTLWPRSTPAHTVHYRIVLGGSSLA